MAMLKGKILHPKNVQKKKKTYLYNRPTITLKEKQKQKKKKKKQERKRVSFKAWPLDLLASMVSFAMFLALLLY